VVAAAPVAVSLVLTRVSGGSGVTVTVTVDDGPAGIPAAVKGIRIDPSTRVYGRRIGDAQCHQHRFHTQLMFATISEP